MLNRQNVNAFLWVLELCKVFNCFYVCFHIAKTFLLQIHINLQSKRKQMLKMRQRKLVRLGGLCSVSSRCVIADELLNTSVPLLSVSCSVKWEQKHGPIFIRRVLLGSKKKVKAKGFDEQ